MYVSAVTMFEELLNPIVNPIASTQYDSIVADLLEDRSLFIV